MAILKPIKPSEVVRSRCETIAKEVHSEFDGPYNQSKNAAAAYRILVDEGIVDKDLDRDSKATALQILAWASNASANRQKIEGKKSSTTEELSDEYADQV